MIVNSKSSNSRSTHVVFNAMSLRPGGGLTVLLGLLRGLATQAKHPIQTTVICSADKTREALEQQQVADNILQKCPNAHKLKRQLWAHSSMGKLTRKLECDVFVSINQYIERVRCPQIVYHLNLLRFIPVAAKSSPLKLLMETIRNRSSLRALKLASANVFESRYLQKCAGQIYQRDVPLDQVIYIGLPDKLIEIGHASEDGLGGGKPESQPTSSQLISITNPNPHKDNTTLIKTISELTKTEPTVDWQLKIAGGLFPELWQKYRTLAEELGVHDRIEWVGFLDQSSLTELLKRSLCLVSTSRVESFCMVALESMARGCPAIVAESSSMPESVGEAAMLVAPGDPLGFAGSIATLYHDRQLRDDFVARGFAHIQNFRWNTCGEKFAELVSDLTDPLEIPSI